MNKKIKPVIAFTLFGLIAACEKNTTPAVAPAENKPAEPVAATAPVAQATIKNPLDIERNQHALYVSYYDLGLPADAEENARLAALINKQPFPQQHVDRDGNGSADGILLSLNLDAGGSANIDFVFSTEIAKIDWPRQTQAEISHKEGGKWIPHPKVEGKQAYEGGSFVNVEKLTPPEHYTDHSNWIRYEGPGIESDKVGYRIYLDWRNGFDIFGKSVAYPVLQNVGQDGYASYHELQDWGTDVLKVGSSLGSGGFGVWNGEKVDLVTDVQSHTATIIENGPIYSSFTIDYQGWRVKDKRVDLNAQFAMTAGSRLVRTTLTPSEPLPNFAIGIVKHDEAEFISGNIKIPGNAWSFIGSWGKQSLNNDMLGMAVFFRKRDFSKIVDDPASWTAQMRGDAGKLEYYFAAAWEGELKNGIQSKAEFIAYLESEARKLTLLPRVVLKTHLTQSAIPSSITAQDALDWSVKMAESELTRKTLGYQFGGWDAYRERIPNFEYDIIGLLPLAYHELAKVNGSQKFKDVVRTVTASFIDDDGTIKEYEQTQYNIDAVAPGKAILRLYQDEPLEKYKIAASHLRTQLKNHPRTSEGAFWHKKIYPWQLWLDGVFMGMPFLAEYSAMFEEGQSFKEVIKEFEITLERLRDEKTGLYYHAWDEKKQQVWADPQTGLSKHFWGRGVGWLAMALVDTLEVIPEDKTELRAPLLQMTRDLAATLIKYQDKETGVWWQIMDMPNKTGNYLESSASTMFTYFLAKATRSGYLPESYKEHARRAYSSLLNEFILVHADGNISFTRQCLVAGLGYGRDGSYDYYMSEQIYANDPKGLAPFILAGIETYRLLK